LLLNVSDWGKIWYVSKKVAIVLRAQKDVDSI